MRKMCRTICVAEIGKLLRCVRCSADVRMQSERLLPVGGLYLCGICRLADAQKPAPQPPLLSALTAPRTLRRACARDRPCLEPQRMRSHVGQCGNVGPLSDPNKGRKLGEAG